MRTEKGEGAHERVWRICAKPDGTVKVDPRACPECGGGLVGIVGRCSHAVKKPKIVTEIVECRKTGRCYPVRDKMRTPHTSGARPAAGLT